MSLPAIMSTRLGPENTTSSIASASSTFAPTTSLLLRFDYSYEVDLDRIHCERDLLAWVLQLVEKPWMGAERVKLFAYVVADIKDFNIHGL